MDTQGRRQLPASSVPAAGYDLLSDFAAANKQSISDAVRTLLAESPRLVEFAAQTGRDVGALQVQSWGGYRERKEEPSE